MSHLAAVPTLVVGVLLLTFSVALLRAVDYNRLFMDARRRRPTLSSIAWALIVLAVLATAWGAYGVVRG